MSKKPTTASEAWGLELGGSTVRLVHVVRTDGGYRADAYHEVPLSERWTTTPSLQNALERLGERARVTGPLGVAVPDEWALHRVLLLPMADPAALSAMVANQMELLLPGRTETFIWSWGHVADPFQPGKARVLLCAARKDALAVLNRCAAALGEAPTVVMPSVMALAAAWPALHEGDGTLLVVDVAAKSSSLLVLHQGQPLCRTVVDEGGDRWTYGLAEAEGLAPAQAESVKLESNTGQLPPSLSSHVQQRLGEATDRWAEQVRQAYDDCIADIPRPRRPSHCVLLGRASLTAGLAPQLGAALRLPTSLASPPPKLSTDSRVTFGQAAGAVSAAVAAMQQAPPLVNLAPRAAAKQPVLQKSWRWAVVAGWLLTVVALLYGLDLYHASSLKHALADAQTRMGGREQLALTQAVGQHLERGAPPPLEVLEEISAIAPEKVMLTSWRYSRKGAISLVGNVPNEAELQAFLKKLSASPLAARVEPGVAKIEKNQLTFEITFTASAGGWTPTSRPTTQAVSRPTTEAANEEPSRSDQDRPSRRWSGRRSRRAEPPRPEESQPPEVDEQLTGEPPADEPPANEPPAEVDHQPEVSSQPAEDEEA